MKKLFAVLGAMSLLTACGPMVESGTKDSEYLEEVTKANPEHFEVICLDGVQYWINQFYGGNSSVLAPRINKDTLLPTKCPQNMKQPSGERNNGY